MGEAQWEHECGNNLGKTSAEDEVQAAHAVREEPAHAPLHDEEAATKPKPRNETAHEEEAYGTKLDNLHVRIRTAGKDGWVVQGVVPAAIETKEGATDGSATTRYHPDRAPTQPMRMLP